MIPDLLDLLRRQASTPEQVSPSLNRLKRRSQLVRQRGKEFVLDLPCPLGIFPGLALRLVKRGESTLLLLSNRHIARGAGDRRHGAVGGKHRIEDVLVPALDICRAPVVRFALDLVSGSYDFFEF